jgi:hypothetical protein
LQETTNDSDNRHVERVEDRFVELRKAERDLEDLTAKVQEILRRPS